MDGLDEILAQAAAWHDAGRGVALATVVRTWGSAPRPVGSKLCIDDRGAFVGSVSGGCIEGAVIGEALELLAGRRGPGVLAFGVSDEMAWEVGLACGGAIEVFVERLQPAILAELRAARSARHAVTLITPLDGGGAAYLETGVCDRDEAAIVEGRLIEPHRPAPRLVLVGAVHIAQPLIAMARLAGLAVTLVDPRRVWATAERFPDVALVRSWPDAALAELALDARTAIVTLTHDPKLDDPALLVALRSPAFYIGCLGSQRTHAARLARLAAAGATSLERLRGPVGLRIGARSPAEIAVSILAEVIAALRGAWS